MLTTAQLTTLAAAIAAEADAEFVALRNAGATGAMAEWLNQDSTFVVWRSEVSVDEYRDALVWTEVDALTAGKARIWEWVTGQMTLPLQASKAPVRQGLADCWASNTTTRTNLLAVAKRPASKAEALFASGTGTTASPGNLGWEGPLRNEDVVAALEV